MNEIRLNKEEEKEIIRAKFKIPLLLIVAFSIFAANGLLAFILGIVQAVLSEFESGGVLISLSLAFLIILTPIFIIAMIGIKKSSCIVTNKRIHGVATILIIKKKYSYRLDEVDNVETTSTLGIHGLALNFSQGHGPQGTVRYNRGVTTINGAGTFRITNIANVDEVHERLSELITSVKNDKDLMVDIEMSKIEAENRKASAFESMANNIGNNSTSNTSTPASGDYIKELKGLKDLLDNGVITQEEFEQKKELLLKK